jgi:hypothetical protein
LDLVLKKLFTWILVDVWKNNFYRR